jgi:hypothetical protein
MLFDLLDRILVANQCISHSVDQSSSERKKFTINSVSICTLQRFVQMIFDSELAGPASGHVCAHNTITAVLRSKAAATPAFIGGEVHPGLCMCGFVWLRQQIGDNITRSDRKGLVAHGKGGNHFRATGNKLGETESGQQGHSSQFITRAHSAAASVPRACSNSVRTVPPGD